MKQQACFTRSRLTLLLAFVGLLILLNTVIVTRDSLFGHQDLGSSEAIRSVYEEQTVLAPLRKRIARDTSVHKGNDLPSYSLVSNDDMRTPNSDTKTQVHGNVLSASLPSGIIIQPYQRWEEKYAGHSLPCLNDDGKAQADASAEGFLFTKPFKVGSSTASGINLRIARNVLRKKRNETTILGSPPSERGHDYGFCLARSDHGKANSRFRGRIFGKSFLWTIVRDPSSRLVSQFFHFHVSRQKNEPSDQSFLKYTRSGPQDMIDDYYLKYLSLDFYTRNHTDEQRVIDINQVLSQYDFIAVNERMDESAVALSMLLGIPIADVLYLDAKRKSGFDDGGDQANDCTYIWPSFVSEGMQKYLDSEEWRKKSQWDQLLHKAVNQSLDLTIDYLGRENFEKNLKTFRCALEIGRERCSQNIKFPCLSNGTRIPNADTDCLWKDSGCGYACLDEVARELDLDQ